MIAPRISKKPSALLLQLAQAAAGVSGESEFEIMGLQSRQQYWIHVRAIRGNEYGTWSAPATRVANL